MEFTINRNIILKSLGHAYGVIEKKNNSSDFIKHTCGGQRIES